MKSKKSKKTIIAGIVLAGISLCAFGTLSTSSLSPRTTSSADDLRERKTDESIMEIRCAVADAANEESSVTDSIVTALETVPATSVPVAKTVTTTPATTSATTSEAPKIPTVDVGEVKLETVSVSCLKATWEGEEDREYSVRVETEAPYQENIFFAFKEAGVCYITGLRENSEYTFYVEPVLKEDEEAEIIGGSAVGRTQAVEVIWEFERENGWTSCFAGERASGLTCMPSSGAIYGSYVDPITDTGIRRFDNGDYCCAMGEWYGECGDRFLVELDNGIQFTVRICDSKGWADDADADINGDGVMDYVTDEEDNYVPAGDGIGDGRFHWFAYGAGKCVIEFIYDDGNLPSCVSYSGSWGYYTWNGLNLCSNIASIKKLATW